MRKYILIFFTVFGLVSSVFGQYKVVERSAKKPPVWYNTSQSEFIITSAIAGDIATAKGQCLDNIRKSIIQSVAENVDFKSTTNIEQKTLNDEIVHFLDSYTSTMETQVAPIAFLKGVSESKIEDSYWEKSVDKKTKEERYVYAVKYPLPSIELKKMIREFEKLDNQMYSKYLELKDGYSNIESVEQIDRAIIQLESVISYFFDRVRKDEASNLREAYRKLYSNIVFSEKESKLGEYKFSLMLNGRDISISQQPQMSSVIATQLKFNQSGTLNTITYNYDMSEYDTENEIRFTFRIGGKSVVNKVYYTVSRNKGGIYPERTAYINASHKSDSTLTDLNITIYFKTTYKAVEIKTMTLDIPGVGGSLVINDINRSFTNENITLTLVYKGSVEFLEKQYMRENIMRGNLEYVADKGSMERVNFKASFKPNW